MEGTPDVWIGRHDQVVEDWDLENRRCFCDSFGELEVLFARSWIAARVVVREDHCGRVVRDGADKDATDRHGCGGDGARRRDDDDAKDLSICADENGKHFLKGRIADECMSHAGCLFG